MSLTTTDTSTTQDDDYTAPPSSATFVAGNFSRTDVNGQQRYRATRDFTVAIIDDTVDESDEVLNVTLAYLTPGLPHLRGGPSTAVVTIQDNEHVPVTLSWEQPDTTVGEGVGSATLRAYAITTLDKRPEDGFSFDATVQTSDGIATQPGDYTELVETVTFSRSDFGRVTVNGQRRYRAAKQVLVPIQDDTSDEDEEDFTATIEYADPSPPLHLQGGPAVMTVKITDNDFVPVTISWSPSPRSVDEDAVTVTLQARATTTSDRMPESGFTVALSATTAGGTATEGSDYRRLNSNSTFRQGDFTRTDTGGGQFRYQATWDISVSITDDTVDEPDEDFTVTLDYRGTVRPHWTGSSAEATVDIVDNDHVPVTLGWEETALTAEEPTSPGDTTLVTLSAMAVTATDKEPESGFTFDFTVNTVNGTARQPDDYEQLSATETFARNDFSPGTVDGQSRWVASRAFNVNVVHDTVDEPLERFTVRLAFVGSSQPHLALGDSTATVTTTDDVASLADLRTSVNANASTVEPGEQLTYDWSVNNGGPAASTNTAITGTLDAGTSYVSAQVTSPATGQCSRTGRTVACTFGTLELNDTASGDIVVEVTDNASADIRFTAIARADQLDRTPVDNDGSASTELIAAPQRITNLRASGASTHIDVTWSRPGDNGNSITRYELERKEAGENYAPVTPGPGVAATTYRDSQVSEGTTYTYQLRAVNADGDAEWSNEATATAKVTPPPPPPPPPPVTGGGGTPPVVEDSCVTDLGPLTAAATQTGTWADDCESINRDASYARFYTFTLSQETEVTIDLTSGEDAYLYVLQGTGSGGTVEEENDDIVSGNTNSQILTTLAAGAYTVEATTRTVGATGSFTLTITVEYLPTVNVSWAADSEDALVRPGSPVSLTVAFSRPVSGFTLDDITVENGAVSNLAVSGGVYTFDVTPNDIGEVTVDIPAGAVEYADGNGNPAALRFSLGITYDDNGDGGISRGEAIAAIRDYFSDMITRSQAIAVIRLYFT